MQGPKRKEKYGGRRIPMFGGLQEVGNLLVGGELGLLEEALLELLGLLTDRPPSLGSRLLGLGLAGAGEVLVVVLGLVRGRVGALGLRS